MFLVFDKYKIDSTRFASSNIYYTSNVDEYIEIYQEIEKRLEEVQKLYLKESDSIGKKMQDPIKFNHSSRNKKMPR